VDETVVKAQPRKALVKASHKKAAAKPEAGK
jgi:hypothetical protein